MGIRQCVEEGIVPIPGDLCGWPAAGCARP